MMFRVEHSAQTESTKEGVPRSTPDIEVGSVRKEIIAEDRRRSDAVYSERVGIRNLQREERISQSRSSSIGGWRPAGLSMRLSRGTFREISVNRVS